MFVTSLISKRRWGAAITVVLMCALAWTVAAGQAGDSQIQRVSVSSTGAQGNDDSNYCQVSPDGQHVLFGSSASNLAQVAKGGSAKLFLRSLVTGALEQISVPLTGINVDGSGYGSFSPDGGYIAVSIGRVFLHDIATDTTSLVSLTPTGAPASACLGSVSAHGTRVAYISADSNLPHGSHSTWDVYAYDCTTGQTAWVSVTPSGEGGDNYSDRVSISGDGRYVAFSSMATNLVPGDTNDTSDIFVRDLVTGTTTRESLSSAGAQANGSSIHPALSADGRFLVFDSEANNLVPNDPHPLRRDVFLRDLTTHQTTTVSVSLSNHDQNSDGDTFISGDGRYVVFTSHQTDLVPGAPIPTPISLCGTHCLATPAG